MGLIDDIATGVFQFHNGTINTGQGMSATGAQAGFNSTTVQLILQKQLVKTL